MQAFVLETLTGTGWRRSGETFWTLETATAMAKSLLKKKQAQRVRHRRVPGTVGTARNWKRGRLMQLTFAQEDLRPLVEAVVAECLTHLADDEARLGNVLAFDEPTAAWLLSLEPHQLRDERLRGRIAASQIVGRRIRYVRGDLLAYLARHRTEART
jgi:hypothetical protein